MKNQSTFSFEWLPWIKCSSAELQLIYLWKAKIFPARQKNCVSNPVPSAILAIFWIRDVS